MATHKSALKRHRQSVKRNERNRKIKSELHTLTKKLGKASEEDAPAMLKTLQSKLAKAGRQNVIHPKNASKKISHVMRAAAK